MGQEVGGSYGGGVTQDMGGGGGLLGADGEANPQPPVAVRRSCSCLLLGLHVGVRRKPGAACFYRGEEKGSCWCFCGL